MTKSNELKTLTKYPTSAEMVPCKTFFVRNILVLRMTGLFYMNSVFTDNVDKSTIWETIIPIIGVGQISILLWFESAQMINRWTSDPDKAIEPGSGAVTCCFCIVKGWVIWINRVRIRKMLRRVAVMWEDSNRRPRIREEILNIAKSAYYWERWYIITAVVACLAYAVRPYAFLLRHHLYEKHQNVSYDYSLTVYPGKYFWSTDTLGKYILCISWEQTIVTFVGLYAIATDCLCYQLTAHAGIEFRVLQHDLEHLVSSNEDHISKENERVLIARLSTIVEKHCNLYRHWEKIKQTFGATIFSILFLTAANTCLCTFQVRKEISRNNWGEVFRNLFHALILGVSSFMHCMYADQVAEQSSLVAEAAYKSQWMHRSKEFKIMLNIIMMRAQRPLDCTIYGLISPNLTQVTLIFKAASSYFALLKSLT